MSLLWDCMCVTQKGAKGLRLRELVWWCLSGWQKAVLATALTLK